MHTRLCGIIKTNTPENPGCFCFSGKCGGESACVGAVLGKRGSGIVTRLTGNARELLPAGAVQPVSAGFLKSVPLCGTPELFTVACGHNPAYAGRCGGTSASLKCGREPAIPPTNAPLLKCGARVRWMAWLVRPHFSTGGFAPYVAEGFAAVALKPSCSPPQRNGGRCHPACRLHWKMEFLNPCRFAAHHNYSLFALHSFLRKSPIPCYNRR